VVYVPAQKFPRAAPAAYGVVVNVATDAARKAARQHSAKRETAGQEAAGHRALPLGIRLSDVITVVVVAVVIELNVTVGGGAGAAPLNAEAYVIGAVVTLPLLLRRRWPLQVLCAVTVLMMLWYIFDRRNITPAPLLAVPVYDAALAGYLAWAIGVPALIMALGLIVVGGFGGEGTVVLITNFLPSFAIFTLAVALGEVVRGRRALAAETASRLRLAEDERRSDAARLLAEERLRIARELHDTVAHGMATITVQASAALRLTSVAEAGPGSGSESGPDSGADGELRAALLAIRETSKDALGEMRAVLGQLRGDPDQVPASTAPVLGLSRLPELRAAITAAGSPVTVTVSGAPEDPGTADSGTADSRTALAPTVDHAAYRILQESLTNVLRHTPAGTPADVRLSYAPESLTITVSNPVPDGASPPLSSTTGNGIRGMRERAAAVGGSLAAGPDDGDFTVTATLPRAQPAADGRPATGGQPAAEARPATGDGS
jgi:signal transduction histidine kinase